MKTVKVLLRFLKLPIAFKIEYYRNVIKCLTGSSDFPNPDVPLSELSDAVDQFELDYLSSFSGSHEANAKMRESKSHADILFRKTANYVNRIADGDESLILSAGFQIATQPIPTIHSIFSVIPGGKPGEVILRCKAIVGAKGYIWQYCEQDNWSEKNWIFAGASTQTKFLIKGLTSTKRYWFRVCALTPKGMQPWLEPVSEMVR